MPELAFTEGRRAGPAGRVYGPRLAQSTLSATGTLGIVKPVKKVRAAGPQASTDIRLRTVALKTLRGAAWRKATADYFRVENVAIASLRTHSAADQGAALVHLGLIEHGTPGATAPVAAMYLAHDIEAALADLAPGSVVAAIICRLSFPLLPPPGRPGASGNQPDPTPPRVTIMHIDARRGS